MAQIDVIIPAYDAHGTLDRCLGSIAAQTVAQDCRVTLVDDCSTEPYDQLLAPWRNVLDIRLLRLEANRGPGMARQQGYDRSDSPFVTYMDADDTLAGAYSLQLLRRGLDDPAVHTCAGAFCEEREGMAFNLHQNDLVWMFGKMYRRAWLDRYKVRFTEEEEPSRANEDNGYNTIVRLLSTPEERIQFIADNVYFWHLSPNSITRINNCQYSYDQSFVGYAANMEYAIKHAMKYRPFSEAIQQWAVQCMCQLYLYYCETETRASRFCRQNWAACARYYDEVYRGIAGQVSESLLGEMYSAVLAAAAPRMAGVAPRMTLWDFLARLKEGAPWDR